MRLTYLFQKPWGTGMDVFGRGIEWYIYRIYRFSNADGHGGV